jgi:hypothetical protein
MPTHYKLYEIVIHWYKAVRVSLDKLCSCVCFGTGGPTSRPVISTMASSVRSLGRASRSVSRSFHTSVARLLLVGPSDPISHLRPVIYDDVPDSTVSKASTRPVRHPYSLREFDTAADSSIDSADTDHGRYQWKMNSQQLDAFNQQFWTEVGWILLLLCWTHQPSF